MDCNDVAVEGACNCQFCKDYQRLKIVLPLVPEEHREWFESIFDRLWNVEEDLSYKSAILDGSWADAETVLEYHLGKVKSKNLKKETI